jgi:hypothetical protein
MAKFKDMDDLEEQTSKKKEADFLSGADMQKKKKGAGGRPKKAAGEKATEQIFINVTKDEKLQIEEEAQNLGISVSALCKIAIKKYMQ